MTAQNATQTPEVTTARATTHRSERSNRSVAEKIHGAPSSVGGFKVSRLFPQEGVGRVDPFLFMDFFSATLPPNAPYGGNAHPHRGFETVTVLLEGEVGYRDSLGNRGVLRPGSVEWMTAGSGIVHDSHGDHAFAKRGGELLGVQLWVNLPKRLKMMDPAASYIPPEAIPVAEIEGGRARVIAGQAHDVASPHPTHVPTLLVDYMLEPNARVRLPLPSAWQAFVLVTSGGIAVPDADAGAETGQVLRFACDASDIVFSSGPEGARVLLGAGEPINEPVESAGPFVMNTAEELQQAYVDYQAGRMGSLPNEAAP